MYKLKEVKRRGPRFIGSTVGLESSSASLLLACLLACLVRPFFPVPSPLFLAEKLGGWLTETLTMQEHEAKIARWRRDARLPTV